MEKYNEINRLGYTLFRFSGEQVKNKIAIDYIKEVIIDIKNGTKTI